MRKEMYKMLAAALMLTISGGVVGSAADTTLDTVYVNADRDKAEEAVLPGGFIKEQNNMGLLGAKDTMDTPFTVSTISNKAFDKYTSPYQGIGDALSFDPSVRADRGGTYTDISIRGMYQSGHSFYVNGIPGLMDQQNIPLYWVDSVSVTSGPNLGVNGSTFNEATGGVVNMNSKKAGSAPNTDLKMTYRGGSSFEEGVDVGRRFGDNDRWGIRVTANNVQGETTIENEKVTQRNLFVNLDQHTNNSKSNFLVGYNYVDHKGGPGSFGIGDKDHKVTSLPSAPDASKLYKPDWFYNEYDNWIMALNHEQKISEHATAFINAGYHREDWYGYIDGNPTILDNAGNFKITATNYPLALTKKYVGIGIKGDFKVGNVKNEYVIGVDKSWMNYWLGNNDNWQNGKWYGHSGNIWQSNSWDNPGDGHYNPPHTYDKQMTGWSIIDTLKAMDDKLSITLGVHGNNFKTITDSAKLKPGEAKEKKTHAVMPTFAISYKINSDLMVYADHTESFGEGTFVSLNKGYANEGKSLDPKKTKQNEIGVKVKTGNFLNTFSYFQMKQANTVDQTINGKKYLVIDGEQTNKGFEWAFTGNLSKKWDLIGGIMYLNSKDRNDKDVNGAADWSYTIGTEYHANEAFSVLGRVSYQSSATINNGTLRVPSYTRFDLGASYETKISNTPVTFNAMCYNLFGKDYWIARSGSSSLSLGAPRTFVFSANFRL